MPPDRLDAPPRERSLKVARSVRDREALGARVNAPRKATLPSPGDTEARAILGVSEGADEAEIQAAYSRLIRMAHPDRGGTAGLAAQLNAARDQLLKR